MILAPPETFSAFGPYSRHFREDLGLFQKNLEKRHKTKKAGFLE